MKPGLHTLRMRVLCALLPSHESISDAAYVVDALIDAARKGYVQYTPGLPLMIGGMDCSPENVASLECHVERIKDVLYRTGERVNQ